jgi:hypothetical protein
VLEAVWDPTAAPVGNPVYALAALAGKAEHALDVLGARVTVGELEGATGAAWLRVMRELRQMLEGLERLDLASKSLELDQQLATMIVVAFREAIGRLSLPPVQAAQITGVFVNGLTFEGGEPPSIVGALSALTERELWDAGVQLADVILAVLHRLDLSAEQWVEAKRAVPEEMRRLNEGADEVVRGELE